MVYTTFHFPESGANLITTDNSDWATNCPEYKVTAVQVVKVAQPVGLATAPPGEDPGRIIQLIHRMSNRAIPGA